MRKINFKKLSPFIPIIGIIIFLYIVLDIGVEKISNTFLLIPIHFYILAVTPFILILIIGSYKWKYICNKQKINLDITSLIKLYLINAFYVTIIPAGLGGYIKIFYLKKNSKAPIEKCITNTLIDITTGSIIGFSLALIGSIVIIKVSPGFFPVVLIFLLFNYWLQPFPTLDEPGTKTGELILAIDRGSYSQYEDGDIIHAMNSTRISNVHLQHICHKNKIGFNKEGLRPSDSLTRLYLEKTSEYNQSRDSKNIV